LADKLVNIVESYFTELRDARRTGAGTGERTYYPAVNNLLNAIGADLKPRVHCISDLGNTGAGHPDFGLYAASQLQKGEPRRGQSPERGVIEMKSVADDTWLTARSSQVSKYFEAYRLVIVTNLRDFLIVGEHPDNGRPEKRERFSLAQDAASFWELVSTPRKSAERVGRAFGEYLKRALTQSVALREPGDLAWFLASYARDALQRVEAKKDLQGLDTIKKALEEALGMKFEADKGEHFFRSTLVQTLFYGVFSSWVLWARQMPPPTGRFEWRQAVWHLNVPFVSALYQQLAAPQQLQPLGLVELLDWTEATLNRVDNKQEFLQRFNDADAVQFFYEPFLEAFDPVLRKELGVWYTPSEVVAYMVARVSLDQVLALLGETTFDIHLNADAWWSNVPARVWNYTLGGYQVIKKWLSYREQIVLGRPLKADEAAYVSEMVRRIAAILIMGPRLDANYAASKAAAVEWKDGAPLGPDPAGPTP
jgi:hypothetical protein